MKTKLIRSVLAAALAIAALPAAAQSSSKSPFSQTIFLWQSIALTAIGNSSSSSLSR